MDRRLREDLVASRDAPRALSGERGRLAQEHLADHARPRRRSRHDLLRGRAFRALRVARRGRTWTLNTGLWNHPHRAKWNPGGGGLCLHTVLVDPAIPKRLTVATSTGGAYRSDDGGKTWQVKNRGVRAEFYPDPHPEFGQCVHKIAHGARPGRLFLQNHWGLYRSDDGGDSWKDVANGVPSDFGFCMGAHPRDPDTAFIVPLHSDGFRCTPDGKLRVYRTRDAGASWQAMTRGLPQKDAFETVVRDAMAVDRFAPAGVYFGTRSGKLFGSQRRGPHLGSSCARAAADRLRQGRRRRQPEGAPRRRREDEADAEGRLMAVRFLIPGPLQPFSGGRAAVAIEASPATVADALAALARLHPGLRDRVVTEQGEVRPHVNVFVEDVNIRDARGLETRVPEGCEIAILPAVSGG